MRVPPWVVCVFPWGIPQLQSDWSLSCDHGLDYASYCENNNNNNLFYIAWTPTEPKRHSPFPPRAVNGFFVPCTPTDAKRPSYSPIPPLSKSFFLSCPPPRPIRKKMLVLGTHVSSVETLPAGLLRPSVGLKSVQLLLQLPLPALQLRPDSAQTQHLQQLAKSLAVKA